METILSEDRVHQGLAEDGNKCETDYAIDPAVAFYRRYDEICRKADMIIEALGLTGDERSWVIQRVTPEGSPSSK